MIQDFGRRSTDVNPYTLARNSDTGQIVEIKTYNQYSHSQKHAVASEDKSHDGKHLPTDSENSRPDIKKME